MIIKLQGGLGNQMFQYAYGRSLELSGKKIIFNMSFFNNKNSNDTKRTFEIDNFNLETKAIFSNKRYLLADFKNKIKRKIGFYQEGLYQSEEYFKKIEAEIKREFTPKDSLSNAAIIVKEKISNIPNSVSLHIRRGDYVENKKTNSILGTLPIEYYKDSINIMNDKLINPTFFIFSDDIEWAKLNLPSNLQSTFVSNEKIKDYEEIILMSLCKNNIIANSSFSWWGAWLNLNKEKIIIAPKRWFKNRSIKVKNMVPKSWITI